MGTTEFLFLGLLVAAIWWYSLIWANYLGWKRGFEAAKDIWKPHGNELTRMWKESAEKAWAELAKRPV